MLAHARADLQSFTNETPPREVVTLDIGEDTIPVKRIKCPQLLFIGQSWLQMHREAGERLPRWQEFDLNKFTRVIEKFCVIKVVDWRADQIEFSLYGEHPTDFIGGGKPLVMQKLRQDPLRSGNYYDIRDRAGRAVDNEAPQYARKTLSWNERNYIEYETLMLPFVPEDGIQRILQPVSARARRRKTKHSNYPARNWCEISGNDRDLPQSHGPGITAAEIHTTAQPAAV